MSTVPQFVLLMREQLNCHSFEQDILYYESRGKSGLSYYKM